MDGRAGTLLSAAARTEYEPYLGGYNYSEMAKDARAVFFRKDGVASCDI